MRRTNHPNVSKEDIPEVSQEDIQYFGILAYAVLHGLSDMNMRQFIDLCNKQPINNIPLIIETLLRDLSNEDLSLLIYAFLNRELGAATSSTALRGTTIATKLLTQQARVYAYSFFETTFDKSIESLFRLINGNPDVFFNDQADLDGPLAEELSGIYTIFLEKISNLVALHLPDFILENSNELIRLHSDNRVKATDLTIIGGYLVLRLLSDFITEFLRKNNQEELLPTVISILLKQLQAAFNGATLKKMNDTVPWKVTWLVKADAICEEKLNSLNSLISNIRKADAPRRKPSQSPPLFILNVPDPLSDNKTSLAHIKHQVITLFSLVKTNSPDAVNALSGIVVPDLIAIGIMTRLTHEGSTLLQTVPAESAIAPIMKELLNKHFETIIEQHKNMRYKDYAAELHSAHFDFDQALLKKIEKPRAQSASADFSTTNGGSGGADPKKPEKPKNSRWSTARFSAFGGRSNGKKEPHQKPPMDPPPLGPTIPTEEVRDQRARSKRISRGALIPLLETVPMKPSIADCQNTGENESPNSSSLGTRG